MAALRSLVDEKYDPYLDEHEHVLDRRDLAREARLQQLEDEQRTPGYADDRESPFEWVNG